MEGAVCIVGEGSRWNGKNIQADMLSRWQTRLLDRLLAPTLQSAGVIMPLAVLAVVPERRRQTKSVEE